MNSCYQHNVGTSPLIISMPHVGLELSQNIANRLTKKANTLADTDWHIEKLYDVAKQLGTHTIEAKNHRYAIDLNRDPAQQTLYPGQFTTGLCPLTDFDNQRLYLNPDLEPDEKEIAERTAIYWQPYHQQLKSMIDEVKKQYGYCLLYDAHSIRSVIPSLFDGRLPDINLGTVNAQSCDKDLQVAIETVLQSQHHYSHVSNARFIGGFITRQYGDPSNHVHAVQMELSQITYMDEQSFEYQADKAATLKSLLIEILQKMKTWGEHQYPD